MLPLFFIRPLVFDCEFETPGPFISFIRNRVCSSKDDNSEHIFNRSLSELNRCNVYKLIIAVGPRRDYNLHASGSWTVQFHPTTEATAFWAFPEKRVLITDSIEIAGRNRVIDSMDLASVSTSHKCIGNLTGWSCSKCNGKHCKCSLERESLTNDNPPALPTKCLVYARS